MSASDPKDLLGRAEDEKLEFKAKDVLRHPATVARVVVAFLNKDGGHLWIGVDESEGRATKLDPVDSFLRETGAPAVEPLPRLSVNHSSLPHEPTVVLLDYKR